MPSDLDFFLQLDDFLQALVFYDKEHIPEQCLNTVKQDYLSNPEFHPDHVRTKSYAAAGLCAWTINIVRYNEVRKENVYFEYTRACRQTNR